MGLLSAPLTPLLAAIFVARVTSALAQTPADTAAPPPDAARARPPRIYTTSQIVAAPPVVDGRLDDEVWREGEWSGDFTQYIPVEGGPPSVRTEVKVLYDAKHVYVAIRSYDDMTRIAAFPTRRDTFAGDIVGICFDSYFDKRTGFEFDLNAAGSKLDLVLSNEGWDTTWDAVWNGKVAHEADAWTAEFQIPLSQLRYGTQDVQVWGMHVWRWVHRLQEESQWNLLPRQGSGRMYNFGELHGIRGLRSFRRIELLPHVVAQVESLPAEDGNPYVGEADPGGALGLDAKIGITSDFTLDATLNPDFGQVEADPSVVNLTTYETFFDEKRPFFLEGKRILNLGLAGSAIAGDQSGTLEGDQLFYSRRIGAPPSSRPIVDEGAAIEMPGQTSIISAVKVTGKTKGGLSVGLLQSVTDAEQANVWFNGDEHRVPVAPTTNYLVGRVQKDWDKGNTMLGGLFTSTHRWLPDDALRRLPSDAFTGAFDLTRFIAKRSYVVEAKGVFSHVAGGVEAIRALQTNPVHYYQRPDADHLGVDTTATAMSGHAGTVRAARYGNSKWLWSDEVRWMSPGLELNDVGYLRQADVVLNRAELSYHQLEPRGAFRQYGFSASREDGWDFGGLNTEGRTEVQGAATFRNKWEISGEVSLIEAPTDTRMLRGGPAMTTSGFLSVEAGISTDPAPPVQLSVFAERDFVYDGGGREQTLSTSLRMRPTNSISVSVAAFYERNVDNLQYVDTARPAGEAKYVLGRLDQETLGLTLRANVLLTPDLSIQYYGSPFVSNGRYGRFKRATDTPRADRYEDRFREFGGGEIAYVPELNLYRVSESGTTYAFGNPDFDFRQFRSNLVARWEFMPGSSLYVVWSQDRTDETAWGRSLTSSLDALRLAPAANVLLVKVSYWFGL
jgi:hypothetical protein